MGLDTKALRERNQLLSSGAALDACEAADEIDSLRAQLAEAKADVAHAHKLHEAEVRELQRINAKVRAAAIEEAARHQQEHCCGEDTCAEAAAIRALAPLPPGFRVIEEEVIHSILGHIEASMQHTHGVDCRGFDDGDDINSDGDCGCGLVSASKARAALAALEDGREKHGT